jgi:hypothetical protein
MVDEEASPNFRTGMNLDSRERAIEMRDQACCGEPVPSVEAMRKAMKPDGMESWVAEKNFYVILRCRISFLNRYVFLICCHTESSRLCSSFRYVLKTVDLILTQTWSEFQLPNQ